MAAYIFDFDGTIADSFSLVCDILFKQAKYLGCKQLTPNEILKTNIFDNKLNKCYDCTSN